MGWEKTLWLHGPVWTSTGTSSQKGLFLELTSLILLSLNYKYYNIHIHLQGDGKHVQVLFVERALNNIHEYHFYQVFLIYFWTTLVCMHKGLYDSKFYFKIFSLMYTHFWILIVFRKTQFFHKAFLISKREFSLCNHSFLFRFECTFVSTSSVECNTEILYLMPLLRNVIPYLDYLAR